MQCALDIIRCLQRFIRRFRQMSATYLAQPDSEQYSSLDTRVFLLMMIDLNKALNEGREFVLKFDIYIKIIVKHY